MENVTCQVVNNNYFIKTARHRSIIICVNDCVKDMLTMAANIANWKVTQYD
jgi:hypothetical protein